MSIFHKRQGQMDYNYPYFYTDTICHFDHLLADDHFKMIVINSLQYLTQQKLIEIYGYVIMPNHIHLIWKMLKLNGKESPAASFTKFTAHQFRKHLITHSPNLLKKYRSIKEDRNYQFWKRDPLAIPLSSEGILIQKLDYIHENPTKEKWNLCESIEDYTWSSAGFYENGIDNFKILTHFRD
ncbi:transposase [Pedobacter sp. MR22-3]|uniref:transposase n=1 Tax=Pedobacter sp. MR22-3 TaxID=2994552 RepID=UPI002246DADA|nr:transposase [Pedobacter sp. MR22-3]MCX2582915.1 transposase [Pedobacter sp. MR22-3]